MELVCTLPFSLGFHAVGKGGREGAIRALAVDTDNALVSKHNRVITLIAQT